MTKQRAAMRLWTAFVLGAGLTVGGVLVAQPLLHPTPAYGQIPDSGAQRERMIDELSKTNKQLTEIVGILKEIRGLQRQIAAGQGQRKRSDKP